MGRVVRDPVVETYLDPARGIEVIARVVPGAYSGPDEMIDCNCQDCDDGCDMVSAPEYKDEDGEPLCYECSIGVHRQDREEA